jgi:hypothetical protein
VTPDGRVQFLPDVYGRDPAIMRALGAAFSFRKRPVVGPKAAAAPQAAADGTGDE